uniref:Ig-like domain-containing protein n=1 Tax=Seriola dumerili TaxID=41447 RepID=A0A3B4VG25_SERDU
MTLSLPFTAKPSHGLQIVSRSLSPTYAAVGDDVTLSCHFTFDPDDLGGIDIEWSTKPADIQREETVVIWYAGDHRIYSDFDHRFQNRVQFVSPDPESGNASITINDLKLTDSDTFQCKVRKLPGISSILIRLDLSCIGSQGSPPMWYTWFTESREKMLPGDLFLTITGEDVLGPYVCNAENLVGSETCTATLIMKPAVSNVAVSAAVTVIVLLIIIISAIVFFCCKRKNVENFGNEIREDELPPHKWCLRTQLFHLSNISQPQPCRSLPSKKLSSSKTPPSSGSNTSQWHHSQGCQKYSNQVSINSADPGE